MRRGATGTSKGSRFATVMTAPAPRTTPASSLSLLVPVAVWPSPPSHDVTALCLTAQARSAVVTGCATGQICLWCVEPPESVPSAQPQLGLSPRVVLLGHTSPIVWLSTCLFERSDALVSLCAGGLLNVWDPMEGRCLSSAAAPLVPLATVGTVLPQKTHAVVGGEGHSLVVVQLSGMLLRCVLEPLDDW